MIDYQMIWESINRDSKNNPLQSQIARRIPSNGIFDVFLATDFKNGIRLLYIHLDSDHGIVTENLPRFKGLEISINMTSLGEFNNKEFIRFTQTIPTTENIFELVISDLCEKVIQLQNKQNLNSSLTRILNEWKLFFEKRENVILSISSQKGLVGELYFLKDYLFNKYSFCDSILFWTGSDRTNHDFQILKKAIEVKTTSGKQHKKFTISSEKQLDSFGLNNLYLSLFSLNLHYNMPDKTLPSLIKEITIMIQDDPIAIFHFQIKLAKYGYNAVLSNEYKIGFSVFDMQLFEVKEGFPRLLQKSLPDGVGDLKYSVMAAACGPFEIKSNILNHI